MTGLPYVSKSGLRFEGGAAYFRHTSHVRGGVWGHGRLSVTMTSQEELFRFKITVSCFVLVSILNARLVRKNEICDESR